MKAEQLGGATRVSSERGLNAVAEPDGVRKGKGVRWRTTSVEPMIEAKGR